MALAACPAAETEFAAFLEQRYGSDSPEVEIFADGETPDRWGIAASLYIAAADQLLLHAIPGRIPFLLLEEPDDPEALAETARVALLAEDAALCLRPDDGPMMIGDRDMGAQFDETHIPVMREEIRNFAEGLL